MIELLFSYIIDELFFLLFGGNYEDLIGNLIVDLVINVDDLYNMVNEFNVVIKDICVGYLNICSLCNKIDEFRLI